VDKKQDEAPTPESVARQVEESIRSGRADRALKEINERQKPLLKALERADRLDPEKLRRRMTI
jgi:hypothetical protein